MSPRVERGQSSVEFALVLPLILLAVGLIAQAGVIVRDELAMWSTVAAAARLAAIDPSNESGVRAFVHETLKIDDVEIERLPPFVTVTISRRHRVRLWLIDIRVFDSSASATMYEEGVG